MKIKRVSGVIPRNNLMNKVFSLKHVHGSQPVSLYLDKMTLLFTDLDLFSFKVHEKYIMKSAKLQVPSPPEYSPLVQGYAREVMHKIKFDDVKIAVLNVQRSLPSVESINAVNLNQTGRRSI